MGCIQSKAEDKHYDDGYGDWNKAYAADMEASKSSMRREVTRRNSRSISGQTEEMNIKKTGVNLDKVNGYAVSKTLGKGAYGEVFLATKGGEKFALKVLKQSALKKVKTGRTGSALDSVKTEIATMKKIAHPNCVLMVDVIANQTADEICLLLEFVDGGTSQKTGDDGLPVPLSRKVIWSHMRHLVLGLEYLHMHNIIHRDIKPDNLLLTKRGVLKIADFGTSCLCEGDANAQKTAGTPPFFSPELCTTDAKGTYDTRVVDLWAVGVTIYLWCCGRMPFSEPTAHLLMTKIRECSDKVPAPPEAAAGYKPLPKAKSTKMSASSASLTNHVSFATSEPSFKDNTSTTSDASVSQVAPVTLAPEQAVPSTPVRNSSSKGSNKLLRSSSSKQGQGLAEVIEGLLTKDVNTRLTLNQLRHHLWLTDNGKLALPQQPVLQVEVSPEEIAQAFTNRQAIAYQSAAGPSTLGIATGYRAQWTREGLNAICKLATKEEADFYRQIADSAHLSPHIPVLYSVTALDEEGIAEAHATREERSTSTGSAHDLERSETYEIRMQDLAGGMTTPCAMAFVMGSRTATPSDFVNTDPRPELLDACKELDPSAPTAEELDQGAMTQLRHLQVLDEVSSTKTMGFRVDAAKTVVGGDAEQGTQPLPLPSHVPTLASLREERDVASAISTFLQHDGSIAKQCEIKLDNIEKAWERSQNFCPRHSFVRTTLLLVYDDANREKVELKMINFGFSYMIPEGARGVSHNAEWSGSSDDHEDGYLIGVRNLKGLFKRLGDEIETKGNPPKWLV